MWSEASNGTLNFQDKSPLYGFNDQIGNLDIFFAKYDHGDKESFDGLGGIVAHSTYPLSGMIHFDGSEIWSTNGQNDDRLDLRYVCLPL